MGRLGLGFGAARDHRRQAGAMPESGAQVLSIAPSPSWTGTAGSGFAAIPADPVRTTAKPVLRLLTPPRQQYTDNLLVGVYAAASDGGSLLEAMGLARVSFHYAGNTIDVAQPSFQTLSDANGIERSYFGWWAQLAHDGRSGLADLFVEAVPRDPAMQNRVIGPYTFLPSPTLYTHQIEVAATPAEIAGQRYRTLANAIAYLKAQNAKRPLVTITEAGTYITANFGWTNASGEGRVTITATAPAAIVPYAGATVYSSATELWRVLLNAVRWSGANLTLDFTNTIQYYSETGQAFEPWFDGCNLTLSDARSLWRKKPRSGIQAQLHRCPTWFTECTITNLYQSCNSARLVRGCTMTGGFEDIFDDADCVIGSTVDAHDSRWFITDVAALTVSYAGASAAATIEATGTSQTKTFVLKENGVEVSRFTVLDTQAAYSANTNYTVQNVVGWINSYGNGWSAVLLDSTRNAGNIGVAAGKGLIFGAQSAKPGPLTLYTAFDLHADFYQKKNGAALENVAVADNLGVRLQTQNIFLSGTGNVRDVIFANNAFANYDDTPDAVNLSSQFAYGTHSHVLIVHNSLSTQNLNTREDVGGYNPDARCLFANNVSKQFARSGIPDPDLVVAHNHIMQGAVPAYATGTTIGGDKDTLFAHEAEGDLAPQGALLANLKPPVLAYDRAGRKRGAKAPVGAVT